MKSSKYLAAMLAAFSVVGVSQAAEFDALGGAFIGPMHAQIGNVVGNAVTTQTMTSTNNAWAARILATDTRDIKSVGLNFSAVSSPGTATVRIETIDATSGKPSGSLYDANATKTFTPAAGWNLITFDSIPTTGLAAGTQYAVVLLKADAATTCTLNSHCNGNTDGNWPISRLTATDGSTRSNFAETTNVTPVCYFVLDDDTLSSLGCVPTVSSGVFVLSSANRCVAQKIVLPRSIVIRGVRFHDNAGVTRTGTPTVDLRMRILTSANAAVSGTTVTIDKDTLTNINGRGLYIPLPPTTLSAGTYRVAFDSAGDGSNNFGVSYITLPDGALQSSSFCYSESTDMGTTFTWTDTTTRMLPFGLELDSIPAASIPQVIISQLATQRARQHFASLTPIALVQ